MKELKRADTQYLAMGQAIADFWDTSDVPQDDNATRIPSYPSLEVWIRNIRRNCHTYNMHIIM